MESIIHFSEKRTLYMGNSIQHWYCKANAYGKCIMDIWQIPELKKYSDGNTNLREAIQKYIKSQVNTTEI